MSLELHIQAWEIECDPVLKLALLWIAESSGGSPEETIWRYQPEKLCTVACIPRQLIPRIISTFVEDGLLVYDDEHTVDNGVPCYRVDFSPWLGPLPEQEHEESETGSRCYAKKKMGAGLRKQVFERDEYRCKHCGDWHDLSVDHIVPESKGGPTELDNLQTLCRSCNSKKGARL